MPSLNPTPTPNEILNTPLVSDKFPETTVGSFLAARLTNIWNRLSHSAVLPSGNGLWEAAVIRSLVKAGHLTGTLDKNGYLESYVEAEYDSLMKSAFDLLINGDYSTLDYPPEPREYYVIKLLNNAKGQEQEMVGYLSDPLTKADAELRANEHNKDLTYSRWVVVHIPS